jgi:hypothetical protein
MQAMQAVHACMASFFPVLCAPCNQSIIHRFLHPSYIHSFICGTFRPINHFTAFSSQSDPPQVLDDLLETTSHPLLPLLLEHRTLQKVNGDHCCWSTARCTR